MNRNTKSGYVVMGFLALTVLLSIVVFAEDYPFGAREVNYIQSSRPDVSSYPPGQIEAEAGNVTELSLVGISTTLAWQGYYGNVSGILTLEDASGNVFYNWSAAEPRGEIFASVNNSIVWSNISCFNWTGQTINLSTEEARYGIADTDSDGINETYTNAGLNSDIFIGSLNISGNASALGITCHTTNPFQFGSQGSNLDNFENFLLQDGAGALVFGGVIENNEFNNITDLIGFDNNQHDFQLLVAEDGHQGQEDTTTDYFFWLELG